MLTIYLSNDPPQTQTVAFVDSQLLKLRIDLKKYAYQNSDVVSVDLAVLSGGVTISNESLSGNVNTASLLFGNSSQAKVKITSTTDDGQVRVDFIHFKNKGCDRESKGCWSA